VVPLVAAAAVGGGLLQLLHLPQLLQWSSINCGKFDKLH
jgi:hypothetical protein